MRSPAAWRLDTDVDYERRGKQVSSLLASPARGGGEAFRIPLAVFNNGDGPSVLLNSGTHGDEFEGPVVLSRLIRSLEPSELRGRVIITPALNLPAVLKGTRRSPVDNADLNRSFPGCAQGNLTSAIAAYVSNTMLPQVDAVYDLHAGGLAFSVLPCALIHPLEDTALMERSFRAMRALGLPAGVVIDEPERSEMLDDLVAGQGKIFLCGELGGGGRLTSETLEIAERSVANFLKHIGILPGSPVPSSRGGERRELILEAAGPDCYVTAETGGLFEPCVGLAAVVEPGQTLGRIHLVSDPAQLPFEVTADSSGVLISHRAFGLVTEGDTLGVVARKMTVERIAALAGCGRGR